ncbi:AMP-binding protein [Saccharopolyspora shandongensis]|uniref:AMP-binding protein n=1 Tax=Saccharopolyspora shandongensis TaxID=418495 RepID=UPI00340A5A08
MLGSAYDERPWLALYDGDVPAAIEPRMGTLLELFAAARRDHPDRVAITYFDGRLSYRELDELSDGLACHLVEQGVGPGDRVALYLQNVPQFAIALLAGWKAGAIVVPLNPMYRSRELTKILADARPAAVVSSEQGWHDVLGELAGPAGVRVAITTSELDLQTRHDPRLFAKLERRPAAGCADLLAVARAHAGRRPPEVELSSSDVALLVYTSGTSGVPKGATNTHGNVVFNAEGMRIRVEKLGGNGIFGLAPLFHITGLVCELGAALALGRQLDLVYRFEPGVVLDALAEHRPCYMVGPSTAYMALMNHPDVTADHFSSLELVYSGGAPLPSAVVEDFRARYGHYIRNGYGLTETTATATSVPAHLEAPVLAKPGTLGGCRCAQSFRTGMQVGADREADTLITSLSAIAKPHGAMPPDERCTARAGRMVESPARAGRRFREPPGRRYGPGISRVRAGEDVKTPCCASKTRGTSYMDTRRPREVAVVDVPDSYRGETVKAYVSLSAGASATAEELVAHCKRQLAAYKYPRSIEILDELPKTATGKILRRELRDTARAAAR